ncbi:hypothetical protein CWI39_0219p0030 [Hamiltosporidium magnivora]|uniref:Uncharacterized protein n=1 Tax=Hamiltosporidium magnivora TaxID=148818 RepID=A0A4Q9LLX1_9MICR|nr:hypothetical protein CWI39_0219p0030 [Hamiltosporidium magnivora]
MKILLLLSIVSLQSISLLILYEKQVEKTADSLYRILLQILINKYNKILLSEGIRIKLVGVLSYSTYSKLSKYSDLSMYGGSNNISDRKTELDRICCDKSVVMAVSTEMDEDISNEVSLCRGRYFINLNSKSNSDTDMFSSLVNGVLGYLSGIFNVNAPNLLENESNGKFFKEKIHNKEWIQKIKRCYDSIKCEKDVFEEFERNIRGEELSESDSKDENEDEHVKKNEKSNSTDKDVGEKRKKRNSEENIPNPDKNENKSMLLEDKKGKNSKIESKTDKEIMLEQILSAVKDLSTVLLKKKAEHEREGNRNQSPFASPFSQRISRYTSEVDNKKNLTNNALPTNSDLTGVNYGIFRKINKGL